MSVCLSCPSIFPSISAIVDREWSSLWLHNLLCWSVCLSVCLSISPTFKREQKPQWRLNSLCMSVCHVCHFDPLSAPPSTVSNVQNDCITRYVGLSVHGSVNSSVLPSSVSKFHNDSSTRYQRFQCRLPPWAKTTRVLSQVLWTRLVYLSVSQLVGPLVGLVYTQNMLCISCYQPHLLWRCL